MTLENGSGTDLKRQGKRHHRLALVMLPLPLPLPLPLHAAAAARSVHTLRAHSDCLAFMLAVSLRIHMDRQTHILLFLENNDKGYISS